VKDEEKQPSKLEILRYVVIIVVCLILAYFGMSTPGIKDKIATPTGDVWIMVFGILCFILITSRLRIGLFRDLGENVGG